MTNTVSCVPNPANAGATVTCTVTWYERGQCGGDRGVLSGDERSGSR